MFASVDMDQLLNSCLCPSGRTMEQSILDPTASRCVFFVSMRWDSIVQPAVTSLIVHVETSDATIRCIERLMLVTDVLDSINN